MRTTSLKILTSLLLLCVMTSTALYYFRLDLLKITFNQLMLASELQIEEVSDLEASFNHITIKKLTVTVGDRKLTLSLDDIALHYSLANWQLDRVIVERATLAFQKEQAGNYPEDVPDVVFVNDVLSTLKKVTLQRLEIRELITDLVTTPVALIWQRKEESQSLHIEHSDSLLLINLDYREENHWRGNMTFQPSGFQKTDSQALDIQFFLNPDKDSHYLSINTELNTKTLSAMATQYFPIPAYTRNVSGSIPLHITSTLPDRYSGGSPISQATIELGKAEIFVADDKSPLKLSLIEPVALQLALMEKSTSSVSISAEKISIAIESPDNALQAFAEFSKLQCLWQTDPACGLDYHASMNSTELSFDQYHLAGMRAELRGDMSVSRSLIDVTAVPGHLFSSARIYIDDIMMIEPALITRSGLNAQYNFDRKELAIAIDQFDALLPKIDAADVNVATKLTVIGLKASAGESLSTQFQMLSDSINLKLPEQWLPALAIRTDVKLHDNILSTNGQLLGDQKKLLLNFDGRHRLDSNRGRLAIATDEFLFDTDSNKLSSWFSTWPYQADLQGGTAVITSEFRWGSVHDEWTMTGTATQTLTDISGYIGDLALVDLDFQHTLDMLSPYNWVSREPGVLTLATFDVGVPITDISLRLSMNSKNREIAFSDITSRLFGGTISSRDFTYDATKETNLLTVNMDDIHIEEIMKLAGYDDIQANGIIDGQIPITIGEQGISIDVGQLSAQSPGGVIRYKPESEVPLAGDNASMKFVTDALQYYQYDTMLADVRYSKEGDLALKIKMQGQNPDLNNGQKINLNLNIEDNIPMLLKSLQSGRVIAEFLSNEMSN